jgi:hypothetical protein
MREPSLESRDMPHRPLWRRPSAYHLMIGLGVTLASVVLPAFLRPSGPLWDSESATPLGDLALRREAVLETTYCIPRFFPSSPEPWLNDPQTLFRDVRSGSYSQGAPLLDLRVTAQLDVWTAACRGLPVRCAWGWRSALRGTPSGDGGWLGTQSEGVTVTPIWSGLLLDIVFWTLLAAYGPPTTSFAIATAVAGFRARRGLCQSCGYPRRGLGHDTVCPECGAVPIGG